jgi:hypothetical protein
VVVALEEGGPRGTGAGFGVSGDGGVAIDDEITVGGDAGGGDLCVGEGGKGEREEEGPGAEIQ